MSKYKGSNPKYGVLNRSDPSPTVGNSYDSEEYGAVDIALSGFKNQISPEIPIAGKYLATVYRVEGDAKQNPSNGHLIRPENILHSSIHKESYSTGRSVIQLRVHIPELMPMIPAAPIFPTPSVKTESNKIINTYPLILGQTENLPTPSVGEKVWVEFQNIYDLKTGLYVAPYKTTRNTINNKVSPASPKDAFNDRGLLASTSVVPGMMSPQEWYDHQEKLGAESDYVNPGFAPCETEIPPSWRSWVESFASDRSVRDKIYGTAKNEALLVKAAAKANVDINPKATKDPIDNKLVIKALAKPRRDEPTSGRWQLCTNSGPYRDYYDSKGYLLKNVECIEGIGYNDVTSAAEEEMQFWEGLRDSNIGAGGLGLEIGDLDKPGVADLKLFYDEVKEISDAYDKNAKKLAQELENIKNQEEFVKKYKKVISGTNIGSSDPYSKPISLGVYDASGGSIKYENVTVGEAINQFLPVPPVDSHPADFSIAHSATDPSSNLYNLSKGQFVESQLQKAGYDVSYVHQFSNLPSPKRGRNYADPFPLFKFNNPEEIATQDIYDLKGKSKTESMKKTVVKKPDGQGGFTVEVKDEKIDKSEQAAIAERLQRYWSSLGAFTFSRTQAWSAAYISYLLRDSGFIGDHSHMGYASNISNSIEICSRSGWYPFSLLRNIHKIRIQVGDVLIKARFPVTITVNPKGVPDPETGAKPKWASIGHSYTHGDVVYKIEGNKAYLSGGNTANNDLAVLAKEKVGSFYDTAGVPHVIPLDSNMIADEVTVKKKGYIYILKRMHEAGDPPDGLSYWMPKFISDEE